ncbi:protein S40-4 [Mercurialis annua]|uniref:protein S40-4 n=1 Tax=Mercurialis annua TaxID=3986 RepID=UPI00215DDE72|nr:protein S40-4 [Mercurialis annua]
MDNNRYGIMRQGSGIWRSLRDSDFEEEDIWDVLRDQKDSDSKNFGKSTDSSISFSISRNLSAARMIPPRANSSGSSSSNHSSHETNFGVSVHQQSAPVNIPDWSKISKKKSSKNVDSWQDPNDYDDDGGGDYESNNQDNYVDGDYDDGDNSYRLPPHEVISRRLARSQISSFSVFEGVGRKLKGRDLSKVRNAVLTRTGFLESP